MTTRAWQELTATPYCVGFGLQLILITPTPNAHSKLPIALQKPHQLVFMAVLGRALQRIRTNRTWIWRGLSLSLILCLSVCHIIYLSSTYPSIYHLSSSIKRDFFEGIS